MIAGTVDIKPTGTTCDITIKTPSTGCELKVLPQTGLSSVTYKNAAGKIDAKFEIKKVAYESNETGLLCPKDGEESEYTGEIEAEGHNKAGTKIGIEVK